MGISRTLPLRDGGARSQPTHGVPPQSVRELPAGVKQRMLRTGTRVYRLSFTPKVAGPSRNGNGSAFLFLR